MAFCSLSSNGHSWARPCITSDIQVFIASVPGLLFKEAFIYSWRVGYSYSIRIGRKISRTNGGYDGPCGFHTLVFNIAVICRGLRASCFARMRLGRCVKSETLLFRDFKWYSTCEARLLSNLLFLSWDSLMFIGITCSDTSTTTKINIWKCRLLLFTDWDTLRTTWGIFGAKLISHWARIQARIL